MFAATGFASMAILLFLTYVSALTVGAGDPVVDGVSLEESDICMDCGYPRVPTYSPIIQCPCLCLCNDGSSRPAIQPDPMTISDWRVARHDIADHEYNPANKPDPDAGSLSDADTMADMIADQQY